MGKVIFNKETRKKIDMMWDDMLKSAGIEVVSNVNNILIINMSKRIYIDREAGNNDVFIKALYGLIVNINYEKTIDTVHIIYSYDKNDIQYKILGSMMTPSVNIYLEKYMNLDRLEDLIINSFKNLVSPNAYNNKVYVDSVMKNIDYRIKPITISNNKFDKWKNLIKALYDKLSDADSTIKYVLEQLPNNENRNIENAKSMIAFMEMESTFSNLIYSTLSYALMYSSYSQKDLKTRFEILSNRISDSFIKHNFM